MVAGDRRFVEDDVVGDELSLRKHALDDHGGFGVYPLRPRLVTRTRSLRLDAGEEVWIAAHGSHAPEAARTVELLRSVIETVEAG